MKTSILFGWIVILCSALFIARHRQQPEPTRHKTQQVYSCESKQIKRAKRFGYIGQDLTDSIQYVNGGSRKWPVYNPLINKRPKRWGQPK